MSYPDLYAHIDQQLNLLSPALTYHSKEHVLDVVQQAREIAECEGLTDVRDLELLKIASLYHDIGFLHIYRGHEEAGCAIVRDEIGTFGISPEDTERICGMIMATRIPQTPMNRLEEIICDADLDYLGRDDFFPIANSLFEEMKFYGYVETELEWNRIQVRFFEQHHYFTATNQQRRAAQKQQHLDQIKKLIEDAER